MSNMRKKLHSQRGASMLIALLFFLLAAMVGSVILASSTANVDRITQRKEQRQDYLALSSAVRFLRGTLENMSGTAAETQKKFGCKGHDIAWPDVVHSDEVIFDTALMLTMPDSTVQGDGKLQKLVADRAYAIYRSKMVYPPSATAPTDTIKFSIQSSEMPTVNVEMTMDTTSYSLTLLLQVANSAEKATMTIAASNSVNKRTDSNNPCTHTCNVLVDSDGDGIEESNTETRNFSGVINTNTLTLSWGTAVVMRAII